MRAIGYDRKGGIEQLYVGDVSEPTPAPGVVVVHVHATCINPGSLAALHGAAFEPIRDLAGEVVAVDEHTQGVALGDAVLGWSDDAAHAQRVAVPSAQLIAKPTGLSWDVAGSLYVTPMAGLACVKAVEPKAGEVVVVSGASGGVGLVAAQRARRNGATVIGLARAEHGAWLQDRGIIPVCW